MSADAPKPAWAQRLVELRRARQWVASDVAREMKKLRSDLPGTNSLTNMIRGDWESGRYCPGPRYRLLLAAVYDIDEAELFPHVVTVSREPAGSLRKTGIIEGWDDEMERRAALHLLAAFGAGTAIPPGAVETVLARVDRAAGGDHIDLDEWERMVYDHDHQLNTRRAGSLVGDLTADIIAMGHLLDRRLTPVEQAGLLRVSAGLSGLLAIEFGDVGDTRAARVSWGTARRTADASGDRDLQVWVRGRAAQDALWARRSDQVVTALADEAIGIADGAPSAGLARAYAAHADVAIGQGDTAGADAALSDLKRTFDHLPDDTAPEQTVFGFRESQLCWAESYVYTRVGDVRAAATLERARALYPPTALAPRANLSLMQALSMVKAREIDAGLHHALDTLQDHPRAASGARLISGHILQALPTTARSLPAARELHALTTGT